MTQMKTVKVVDLEVCVPEHLHEDTILEMIANGFLNELENRFGHWGEVKIVHGNKTVRSGIS